MNQKTHISPDRSGPSLRLPVHLPGAMSTEAALVLPLYIFFLVNIVWSVEMIRLQGNISAALHQAGSRICYYAFYEKYGTDMFDQEGMLSSDAASLGISVILSQTYVRDQVVKSAGKEYLDSTCLKGGSGSISYLRSSVLAEDGIVHLVADYRVSPLIPVIAYDDILLTSQYYGHAWTGYEGAGGQKPEEAGEEEETVFITEYGTVYHRDRDCVYLNPSVRQIPASSLGSQRSRDGSIYYACESCRPGRRGAVYVTPDGNRYHSDPGCPGLKRTIREVPLSKAAGRLPPCSKCGY